MCCQCATIISIQLLEFRTAWDFYGDFPGQKTSISAECIGNSFRSPLQLTGIDTPVKSSLGCHETVKTRKCAWFWACLISSFYNTILQGTVESKQCWQRQRQSWHGNIKDLTDLGIFLLCGSLCSRVSAAMKVARERDRSSVVREFEDQLASWPSSLSLSTM